MGAICVARAHTLYSPHVGDVNFCSRGYGAVLKSYVTLIIDPTENSTLHCLPLRAKLSLSAPNVAKRVV